LVKILSNRTYFGKIKNLKSNSFNFWMKNNNTIVTDYNKNIYLKINKNTTKRFIEIWLSVNLLRLKYIIQKKNVIDQTRTF